MRTLAQAGPENINLVWQEQKVAVLKMRCITWSVIKRIYFFGWSEQQVTGGPKIKKTIFKNLIQLVLKSEKYWTLTFNIIIILLLPNNNRFLQSHVFMSKGKLHNRKLGNIFFTILHTSQNKLESPKQWIRNNSLRSRFIIRNNSNNFRIHNYKSILR